MNKRQSVGNHEFNLLKSEKSPYYYIRLMHKGKRLKFSTGESNKRKAKEKAAAIAHDLKYYGPKVALEKHALRKIPNPADPLLSPSLSRRMRMICSVVRLVFFIRIFLS